MAGLADNYYKDKTKPYAVTDAELDTTINYLNTVASENRAVTKGGTGIISYVIGDMIYASASTTLATIGVAFSPTGTQGDRYFSISGGVPTWEVLQQSAIKDLEATDDVLFNKITLADTTPIVISSGSAVMITNLDADKWDGYQFADYLNQDVKSSNNPTFNGMQLNNQRLTALGTPTAGSDSTTKDYVDSLINGLDWQESVLSFESTEPGTPSEGDRHILSADWGINGDSIHDIAIRGASSWTFITPNEGYACRVEDEDVQYTFNGTIWVKFGTTVDHGNLINTHNLTTDIDHDQLTNFVSGEHFLQSAITVVGTIATGVWSADQLVAGKVPNHDDLNGVTVLDHVDWSVDYASADIHIDNLPDASTSAQGVSQLTDSTSTTSSIIAATATAVKSAYDIGNHSHSYTTTLAASTITGGDASGYFPASLYRFSGNVQFAGGSIYNIDSGGDAVLRELEIQSTDAKFIMYETDGPTNEKIWEQYATGGELYFRIIDDARTGIVNWMKAVRNANDISLIELMKPTTVSALLTANGGIQVGDGDNVILGAASTDPTFESGAFFRGARFGEPNDSGTNFVYVDGSHNSNPCSYWGNDTAAMPTTDTVFLQISSHTMYTNSGSVLDYSSGIRGFSEILHKKFPRIEGIFVNMGDIVNRLSAIVNKQELKISKLQRVINKITTGVN